MLWYKYNASYVPNVLPLPDTTLLAQINRLQLADNQHYKRCTINISEEVEIRQRNVYLAEHSPITIGETQYINAWLEIACQL